MAKQSELLSAYNSTTRAELDRGVDPRVLDDIGYDFFEATQAGVQVPAPEVTGRVTVGAVRPEVPEAVQAIRQKLHAEGYEGQAGGQTARDRIVKENDQRYWLAQQK